MGGATFSYVAWCKRKSLPIVLVKSFGIFQMFKYAECLDRLVGLDEHDAKT